MKVDLLGTEPAIFFFFIVQEKDSSEALLSFLFFA